MVPCRTTAERFLAFEPPAFEGSADSLLYLDARYLMPRCSAYSFHVNPDVGVNYTNATYEEYPDVGADGCGGKGHGNCDERHGATAFLKFFFGILRGLKRSYSALVTFQSKMLKTQWRRAVLFISIRPLANPTSGFANK